MKIKKYRSGFYDITTQDGKQLTLEDLRQSVDGCECFESTPWLLSSNTGGSGLSGYYGHFRTKAEALEAVKIGTGDQGE